MDFRINFAIVDLPEPDSPARTKTSPRFRENETSSAALTMDFFELKTLFLMKYFVKFSILRISSNTLPDHLKYIKKYGLEIIVNLG